MEDKTYLMVAAKNLRVGDVLLLGDEQLPVLSVHGVWGVIHAAVSGSRIMQALPNNQLPVLRTQEG